ncbi:unnamed protein product [Phaeothamnion confervicola]
MNEAGARQEKLERGTSSSPGPTPDAAPEASLSENGTREACSLSEPSDAAAMETRKMYTEPPIQARFEAKDTASTLREWLADGKHALALSPQFFGFYAHIGALLALEKEELLQNVSFVAGASAGALIGGMLAAGVSCEQMQKVVLGFRRHDFWDFPGFGGILRGRLFQSLIEGCLPDGVRTFAECPTRCAFSAFDVLRLSTCILAEGDLATALRASCTFPLLFTPVLHPQGGLLVDGGVRDTSGMWCVPEADPNCHRILHVTFGTGWVVPPSAFPVASRRRPNGCEVVSVVLPGLPAPHPFAMERGADALHAACDMVSALLDVPLARGDEERHYVALGGGPPGVARPLPLPPPASLGAPFAEAAAATATAAAAARAGAGAAAGDGKANVAATEAAAGREMPSAAAAAPHAAASAKVVATSARKRTRAGVAAAAAAASAGDAEVADAKLKVKTPKKKKW